jgi:exonuclease VII small subunit
MSDTPRTELMVERAPIGLRTNVAFEQSCDLCRQLERELNEANKTISLQHELMTTAEKRGVDKAKEELNEAKDRIKRLEEAGDAMEKYCSDYYSCNKWYKAKEAKP